MSDRADVGIAEAADRLLATHIRGREVDGIKAANAICLASIRAASDYLVQFHGRRVAYAVLTEFAEGILDPELPR